VVRGRAGSAGRRAAGGPGQIQGRYGLRREGSKERQARTAPPTDEQVALFRNDVQGPSRGGCVVLAATRHKEEETPRGDVEEKGWRRRPRRPRVVGRHGTCTAMTPAIHRHPDKVDGVEMGRRTAQGCPLQNRRGAGRRPRRITRLPGPAARYRRTLRGCGGAAVVKWPQGGAQWWRRSSCSPRTHPAGQRGWRGGPSPGLPDERRALAQHGVGLPTMRSRRTGGCEAQHRHTW